MTKNSSSIELESNFIKEQLDRAISSVSPLGEEEITRILSLKAKARHQMKSGFITAKVCEILYLIV